MHVLVSCKSSRNNWMPCKLTRSNSVVWDIRIGHHRTFLFQRNCQWWELPPVASEVCSSTNYRDVWWWPRYLLSARWSTSPLPSRCTSLPRCSVSWHMDWTKGPHWIPCAFPRPNTHGLFFVGILKKQSLWQQTKDIWCIEIGRRCRDIPNDMFRDVCESLRARYQRCLDNNGHQFEHLQTWFFNCICLIYSMLFLFTLMFINKGFLIILRASTFFWDTL